MTDASTGTTAGSSTVAAIPPTSQAPDTRHPANQYDFGFLPIPKRLRHGPDKPFHFGMFLNVFFGICSTMVCANLYYCQPILSETTVVCAAVPQLMGNRTVVQLSNSFSVTYEEISRIPTLVQVGYGIGLLTISPMGDMLRRRGLILFLVLSSMFLTIGLAVTKNLYVFEVLSFLVGLTSVSPQIFLPLAADLAPPEQRAAAISWVSSGIMMGVLIARVFSGIVANFVSWRYVYWMSISIQGLVLIGSYVVLPDYPAKNRELSYLSMFCSMARLMAKEPLVVQIVLITIAGSATYTNFWITLTFLLGGPPYYYSTIVIGLFGLLGIVGVVVVPLMGRVIDRLSPWYVALVATLSLLAFQAVQLGGGGINVSAVIIACFGLDVARQTQHIALTTLIYSISETARSRLNSLLWLAVFLGQIMGTAVGTEVFVSHGWRADATLVMGWIIWQLGILLLRGPDCQRQLWIGWEGGSWVKTKVGSVAVQVFGRAGDCEKADIVNSSADPDVAG